VDRSEIPLTNRELQVLRHVALGLSNREIGRSLGSASKPVKEHVQNILRKIDVADRTQAAVWPLRRAWSDSGLLRPRVCSFIDCAQSRGTDVRVDLGGNEALVTQQLLHAANVGAPIK